MGKLTTHVLDTASGKPGQGIAISLHRVDGTHRIPLGDTVTNSDGRCDQPLLSSDEMLAGIYELEFAVGDYFRSQPHHDISSPAFLDNVILRFGIAEADEHYHVPLLVSPYGYSTYRGS